MKTLAQILSEALTQAGLDSTYNTQARGWVNTILEAQCRNFDWPYYAKTWADQPFVPGQTIYSLPADFARPNQNAYVIQNNQRSGLIKAVDRGLFEVERQTTSLGTPQISTIEWDYAAGALTPVLIFDAVPAAAAGLYFRLPYFRIATSVATDGTDDTKIPDFMPQDFLINELKKYAFENLDDERYAIKDQENKNILRDNKMNANMAKTSKINLAPEIFPPGYKGPGSTSGGNGWMGP